MFCITCKATVAMIGCKVCGPCSSKGYCMIKNCFKNQGIYGKDYHAAYFCKHHGEKYYHSPLSFSQFCKKYAKE